MVQLSADSEFGAFDLISIYPTGIACGFNSGLDADATEYEYLLDRNYNQIFTLNNDAYDYDKFYADRTYFGGSAAKELAAGKGTDRGGLYIDISSPECREKFRATYAHSIDLWNKNFGIDAMAEPVELNFEMYEHGGSPVIDSRIRSSFFRPLELHYVRPMHASMQPSRN